MSDEPRALAREYASALQDYLGGAGEAALQRAYEIGRAAVSGGMGLGEITELHNEALLGLVRRDLPADSTGERIRAAGSFFVEALSLFEIMHREFREANAALRRWNERLEEEAKRIAHALHDEAGQLLASVHLVLEEVAQEAQPSVRERLRKARVLLDGIEEQLRRLSHELRPTVLDDLGLLPALQFLAEGVATRTGIAISVDVPALGRLPVLIETAIYRTVQEALNNTVRHAGARCARVRVWRDARSVHCGVRDDGCGFDADSVQARKGGRGLGLIGIRERLTALGGTLQITSTPGRGTELLVAVPLEA